MVDWDTAKFSDLFLLHLRGGDCELHFKLQNSSRFTMDGISKMCPKILRHNIAFLITAMCPKKVPNQGTGLWNRGPLKVLNGTKLILDDQGDHFDSSSIIN